MNRKHLEIETLQIESKRVQYRKYLDRAGVVDAMRAALLKLYSEPTKPDDAVRFVRKYMCVECPDDDAYERLQAENEEANEKILAMEREMDRMRDYMKIPPDEQAKLLAEELNSAKHDHNDRALVFFYLTDDVIDEYRDTLTPTPGEAHIFECLIAGLRHPNAKIGVYACDAECYHVYHRLFDPILLEYHHPPTTALPEEAEEEEEQAPLQPHTDWGSVSASLDPEKKYIALIRCSVSRNIVDYPFFPKMKGTQYKEIEEMIRSATSDPPPEFEGGTYVSYGDLDKDLQQDMIGHGVLFDRKDPVLTSAGAYTNWPMGRGVFFTPDESFMIWVNAEDHVKVIARSPSGDLGTVYSQLVQGIEWLQTKLEFKYDSYYGYLTSCPGNVGTGFHASCRLFVPFLFKDNERLEEILMTYQMERSTTGIDPDQASRGAMEVTNLVTLGHTEIDLVTQFQNGLTAMLVAEQELEQKQQE